MGRMNGKGLILCIPGRRRLKTTHVRSMAELGLCIAADDLVVVGEREPFLLLFGSALAFESDLHGQ